MMAGEKAQGVRVGKLWVTGVRGILWKWDLLFLPASLCYFLQGKRHQRLVLVLTGS